MKWTLEHTRRASRFAGALRQKKFDFFTGVPCSLLGALFEELSSPGDTYVAAAREDAALGMAAGAWLGGRRAAVLMQNSGLGYSLNVLTSLNLIYRIPVLLVISWRGHGPDAPEHLVMGKSCQGLLQEIGVPVRVPDPERLLEELDWADTLLRRDKRPVALLIKKGIFGA